MNSSASNFFSRDVFLRCQARRNCRTKTSPSTKSSQDIISVTDEPRASKLKRRHVNLTLADIQLAKTVLDDSVLQHPGRLASTRPARLPSPSPDSKSSSDLEFSAGSLMFPRPPSSDYYRTGSESPVPSMSSSSSTSTKTQSPSLPTTPDHDEYFSCHQSRAIPFHPVLIKPLVITKHNRPAVSRARVYSTLPSKLAPKCPLPPPPMPQDDAESDSDSEWYSRELSKIITLRSSALPNLPLKARPDSMCISENPASSPQTTHVQPSSPKLHSSSSRRRNYTSRPPLSVPTSPKRVSVMPSSVKSSISRVSRCTLLPLTPLRRPPPRSSIPADCVLIDDTFTFSDDSDSAFSFSLYDRSPLPSARPDSPKSAYSQRSFLSPCPSPFPPSFPSTPTSAFPFTVEEEFDFPVEDLRFDMKLDRAAMPPLDIPTSPLDLEMDFTFEQLRNESYPRSFCVSGPTTDEKVSLSSHAHRGPGAGDNARELRSRWSSSTLNSVRGEHSRRSAIGVALRTYFGSPPSGKPKTHSGSSSRRSGSDTIPKVLTSMARKHKDSKRESDVMVIGYGHGA